jgi:hypothetical protein
MGISDKRLCKVPMIVQRCWASSLKVRQLSLNDTIANLSAMVDAGKGKDASEMIG